MIYRLLAWTLFYVGGGVGFWSTVALLGSGIVLFATTFELGGNYGVPATVVVLGMIVAAFHLVFEKWPRPR